ncbi:MAG: squalene/phytoene synthase family protein [Salibaculum sp.]|jgi:phytoene synthase|uniref:phytoene/squalene synthase family protein n=1 Tax=Roseovarius halophilus (ex Wu et al. 2025) TaxID=3376060 RepID=UPI00286FB81A|nr:squalene/phytoene synthase family protein [Salibaculum sp.]MDR9428552.1 squalene/phytoene synthase family protein [Salibaculum sp.]MDR9482971.1 squalene/phytoene synthase family protein [Salibaculum sp.]
MTPDEIMRQHARSFAPAARLLGRFDRARIARLYALCRTVDDLADNVGGPDIRARLVQLAEDLYRAHGDDPLAEEARDLFAGNATGLAAFGQLVMTVADDTGPCAVTDDAALDRYCMGVAGTVGIMVCALFDVDKRWHAAACDLGKAMQLTNICRDVRADAVAGRRYLPATLCPHTPQAIAGEAPEAARDVRAAVATLLQQADALYRSGRSGLPALPPRLRLAVAAASEVYGGIGDELRARDCDALSGRVVVPRRRKARLFVTAAAAQLRIGVIGRQEADHAAT